MNDTTFKTGIAFLSKLFGHTPDVEIIKTYWNILKKYSEGQFKIMLENITKDFVPTSQVPFPLPKHFLSAVGESGESRARLAILALTTAASKLSIYDTISFGDRALHATIERFGGWPEVANWTQDDWRFNEKNFIGTYEASSLMNYGPDRLIGIAEFENGKKTLSGKQLEIAKKQEEIKYFEWSGFDETMRIEDKNKEQIKLTRGEFESVGEILANFSFK